jgi:hypothetical protein
MRKNIKFVFIRVYRKNGKVQKGGKGRTGGVEMLI